MNSKDFFGGGGRLRALLALFPLFAASAYALPEALVSAHAAGCRPLGVHGEHGEQFNGLAAGVAEASPCSCELTPGVVLELRSIRILSYMGSEHREDSQDAFVFCVELAVVNHTNRDVTMTTESSMVRPFTLATCRLLCAGNGAELSPEPYPLEGNSGQYSCRIAPGACDAGEVYSPVYRLAELDDRFVFDVSGTLAIDAAARPYRLRVPVCPGELLRSAETLCAAVRGGMRGACRGGDTDTLRVCLAAGADVRGCVDAQGRSLLHLAAEERGAEIAEMLLAAGADADARDGRGYTPLHTAAEYDAAEVVRLLRGPGRSFPLARRIISSPRCTLPLGSGMLRRCVRCWRREPLSMPAERRGDAVPRRRCIWRRLGGMRILSRCCWTRGRMPVRGCSSVLSG